MTPPAVSVAPTAVSFGTITQGVISGSQNVTLTSAGSAPLHISSVILGGANPGDFTMNNGCNAPAYAVNATCTIHVTFAPLTAGQRAATIAITDDASGSPQTISINGNVAAAFTVVPGASGSLSAIVTAGQSAAYNLQVVPASDFMGSISFSCTGAPLAASCVVPQPFQIKREYRSLSPSTCRLPEAERSPHFSALRALRHSPPCAYSGCLRCSFLSCWFVRFTETCVGMRQAREQSTAACSPR